MFEVFENKYSVDIIFEKFFFENYKNQNKTIYENDDILVTPANIKNAINAFEKNFFLKKTSYKISISLKNTKQFFNISKDSSKPIYTQIHSSKHKLRPYFLKSIFPNNLVFKDYQNYGINWLQNDNSRLLADDMGLGKTLQSLAAAANMIVTGKINSVLIICPNSLVLNWTSEIHKWLPDFCVTQVSSTKSGNNRDMVWKEIYANPHFCVTSYDQLRTAPEVLKTEITDLVIFDEAHKLRKSTSKINKSINSLNFKKAWALTGTPIEKNINDLMNILCVIDKNLNVLTLKKFSDSYINGLTSDYLLRRMKSDVLNEMQDFEEKIIYLELTNKQQITYDILFKKFIKGTRENQLKIFNKLKQVCDIDLSTRSSIKIDFAMEVIEKVVANSEKCVVFSFWLDPFFELKNRLDKTYNKDFCIQFDGSLDKDQREVNLEEFKKNPNCSVLLCSGKIGGEGINLTEANHVIFLNSWWNPSNNNQARDRVIRIGQKKKSFIYYLRTQNTIESRLEEILEEKEYITENVIDTLIFELKKV